MAEKIIRSILDPALAIRHVWRKIPIGSFGLRCKFDAFERPQYAFGIYQSAKFARALGLGKISVIEFGVGFGGGLLLMEEMAAKVSREIGTEIDVYGFDSGGGLPAPQDFRDLPYQWRKGDYKVDRASLERRLRKAKLIMGDVKDTVPVFTSKYKPAPIGFVAFDLDFYSSTAAALKIFAAQEIHLMPRIFCYFDDILGDEFSLFNEYTGELLAMKEFNESNEHMKLCKINGFSGQRYFRSSWPEAMYALHAFNHGLYNKNIANEFKK